MTPEEIQAKNDEVIRQKINKLVKKILDELPSDTENEITRGWMLMVVKAEADNPRNSGVQQLSNLTDPGDVGGCFEAAAYACLVHGIPPKALADGLTRTVARVMQAQKNKIVAPDGIIVPGKFGKN